MSPPQLGDDRLVSSPATGEEIYSTHRRYLIDQLVDEVRLLRGGTEIQMRKA